MGGSDLGQGPLQCPRSEAPERAPNAGSDRDLILRKVNQSETVLQMVEWTTRNKSKPRLRSLPTWSVSERGELIVDAHHSW